MSRPTLNLPSNSARNTRLRERRRRRFRWLLGERLEARHLLTAVASVNPEANTATAPQGTDISATFDQPINPTTATHDTFVVSRQSTGELSAATASINTSGQTVTIDPAADLLPGEVVKVTATGGIQSTGGEANDPRVWEFRAEVTSGSGQFEDSGQRVGANDDGKVLFGDLDGDGDQDVIFGGDQVLLNDGAGVFTSSGQNSLGAGQNWDLADIEGDGDLDIVGQGNIFVNDGSGVFTATGQDLTPGVGGQSVEVGDLDGDGDMDAMVGVAYGGNLVWLNDGAGTFTNTGQSLGNSNSEGIGFGDFDGDGDLDAYVANNGPQDRVYTNDGSGVFTDSNQTLGGFAASVAVEIADLDGDGDLDAAVANGQDQGPGSTIWLNDGSGIFTDTGQRMNNGTNNPDVALGDIDGDGDLDLYITGLYQASELWENDGSATFSLKQSFPFPTQRPGWATFVDVDGDGDLDVFEANRFSAGSKVLINQNLQPSVTLGVDSPTIAENADTATITATISAAHTEAVTIELETSGTATLADDYTISTTQIEIPVGSTSGSVTVTALQDAVDDDDETVVVDISSVTGGQETGTQQVTITIIDDDDPVVVPDVTLAVDNAEISEAGGVATFTATLSAVTTVSVTVDLETSGTADESDFDVSATQIVIAPGASTGSVTVTAVDDDVDEANETVVVDITSVAGGNESGTQQQTTTITDNDEPVVPSVTLAVDNSEIAEAGGVATFTATLSESTTVDVTVDLEFTGTATSTDDYTASGTQIAIAAGETTGSVTVSAVQDELDEPDETVIADISGVVNGTESDPQQATTTITDDDEPQGFAVTDMEATATGVQVTFTNPIDVTTLSLYDNEAGELGPADVTVVGAASGPVSGSLVASDRMVEFISTGGPLGPDTYTVTLRSGDNGFKDNGGLLLDGDGDGTPGDDYSNSFEVAAPAADAVTVSIPDFVRGPGQDVNVPADSTLGIPLTLSEGMNVRAIDAQISYDPALLSITAAAPGPDAPAGASVIINNSTPGLAILVYFSSAPLPAGAVDAISLTATIPADNAGENYRRQQVLDVHSVVVSDGNDNESPVIEDDALHSVTYFGDVTANGRINAADAAGVARIAALLDGGFVNTPSTDPGLLGDISGNSRLNAADAALVAQAAALIEVPEIPPIPAGVQLSGVAPAQLAPTSQQQQDPADEKKLNPTALAFVDYTVLGIADVDSSVDLLADSREASSRDIDWQDLFEGLSD